MAWIEIKEGCDMPQKRGDIQLVICGEVASGYYVPPIPRASGGMTRGWWMEYTLKGSADCKPSHWQPMASFPEMGISDPEDFQAPIGSDVPAHVWAEFGLSK